MKSSLAHYHLQNQRVFLRADLNVPLKDGAILDDKRLHALMPTINLIREKGGRIILATHIGRPNDVTPELSTKQLIPWFAQQGLTVKVATNMAEAKTQSRQLDKEILLLENLRFFPGEKTKDLNFAQQLKETADYYVNDAFGLLHRNDTSITLLPKLFAQDHRTIGLLIQQELATLQNITHAAQKPFVLIIGGKKIRDKLPLMTQLLKHVDTILLCPAITFTFLKSMGKQVGNSLVDENTVTAAQEFLTQAKESNVKIMLPIDYQVAQGTQDGPLSIIAADDFGTDDVGISIGPKTVKLFTPEITKAGTILFNGVSGFLERPETLAGAKALLIALGQAPGFSIVAGGDSMAVVDFFGLETAIDHISTGGGTTLAYFSGQELPGLKALG